MSDIVDQFEKDMNKVLFRGYASKAMFCKKSGKILDYKTVMKVIFDDGVKKAIEFFHSDERTVMIADIKRRSKILKKHNVKIIFDTLSDGEEEIKY